MKFSWWLSPFLGSPILTFTFKAEQCFHGHDMHQATSGRATKKPEDHVSNFQNICAEQSLGGQWKIDDYCQPPSTSSPFMDGTRIEIKSHQLF